MVLVLGASTTLFESEECPSVQKTAAVSGSARGGHTANPATRAGVGRERLDATPRYNGVEGAR